MHTGIGCFKHCDNLVIGQCQGYKIQCGQFYCKDHSADKLCIDCANRLFDDVATAETQRLYRHLAEETHKADPMTSGGCMLGCLGIFVVLLIIMIFVGFTVPNRGLTAQYRSGAYAAIGLLTLIGLVSLLIPSAKKRHLVRLNMLNAKNPGFAAFYQEFKKFKKQEANSTMLGIATTIFLVGGAAHAAVQDYKLRQDINTIAKSVDKYR